MFFKSKIIFQKELENFRPDLYRLAWSWCHSVELADDLVQETCCKALKNKKQLRDISKIKPWLTRILVNKHRDYLRTQKSLVELNDIHLIELNDPSIHLSRVDTILQMRAAIALLNNDHQKIITLVDLADFTYSEVADILDVPVGTVMSRLNRARHNLKHILESTSSNVELLPRIRIIK